MRVVRTWQVVASLAVVLTLAGCSSTPATAPTTKASTTTTTRPPSHPLPVVDTAATPKGWVAVDYGMAQISVHGSWNVYYEPQCFGGGERPGWVQVGPANTEGVGCPTFTQGDPKAPYAVIEPIDALGSLPIRRHLRRIVVNGITAYQEVGPEPGTTVPPPLHFYVPRLGAELTVSGVDAITVLHTLTWSPRAVVLTKDRLGAAPKDWKTVTAHVENVNMSVKVPPSWLESHSQYPYGECEPAAAWQLQNASGTVVISSDKNLVLLSCPNFPSVGTAVTASNWLRVDEMLPSTWMRDVELVFPAATSKSCFEIHSTRLCPATSPTGSILFLETWVNAQAGGSAPSKHLVVISLGLGGNGQVARQVLDSIRESTTPSEIG